MTNMSLKASWVAVDWGTSNFRAFLMTPEGQTIDKLTASCGLLAVPNGQFSDTFQQLVSPWADSINSLSVLFAGMVGSQQGWRDVPYVSLPVSPDALIQNMADVTLPWGKKGWIVPGATGDNDFDLPDVMRGEEVQLMGLVSLTDNCVTHAILPGTHSKHVHVKSGELTHFQTYMTGELFSVLKQHSILGRQLPEQQHCDTSYLLGVDAGRKGALSSVLFSARTQRLFNHVAPENVESYLSGVLIGAELGTLNEDGPIYLVGDEKLCQRYLLAIEHLDLQGKIMSGDECFLAGMTTIYQQSRNRCHVA
ncbi:2-dehydro-3-deoxygalactonokinase [Enterovibrio sp. ZSDZ35]|uniref:2-dehydro-3-deoxygalactonokinase n=1 Tax=Enterovibrio qingdaonensis TaxID=2899818 RepID=A0ABT5QQY4_9GAMM|nr:2-dehydro-3-deoxygalactonokinase [Enterovibrio sp. ZSDZ35]MDD1783403.1 2-dehydro-3-deoxygalactonokinase [Enterovibrio sp. ZSDZ35]